MSWVQPDLFGDCAADERTQFLSSRPGDVVRVELNGKVIAATVWSLSASQGGRFVMFPDSSMWEFGPDGPDDVRATPSQLKARSQRLRQLGSSRTHSV